MRNCFKSNWFSPVIFPWAQFPMVCRIWGQGLFSWVLGSVSVSEPRSKGSSFLARSCAHAPLWAEAHLGWLLLLTWVEFTQFRSSSVSSVLVMIIPSLGHFSFPFKLTDREKDVEGSWSFGWFVLSWWFFCLLFGERKCSLACSGLRSGVLLG